MPKKHRPNDDAVDYDPDPVYLDEDEEKQDREADGLPLQPVEKAPPKTFFSSSDDGEGIEIPVDEEKQWYVIHCYSGYENKVRHAIEQRIETMGMQDKIF